MQSVVNLFQQFCQYKRHPNGRFPSSFTSNSIFTILLFSCIIIQKLRGIRLPVFFPFMNIQFFCKQLQGKKHRHLRGKIGFVRYNGRDMIGNAAVLDPGKRRTRMIRNRDQSPSLLFHLTGKANGILRTPGLGKYDHGCSFFQCLPKRGPWASYIK